MMRDYFMVEVCDISKEGMLAKPSTLLIELVRFLADRGFSSLETMISETLQQFFGQSASQLDFAPESGDGIGGVEREIPVFSTCLRQKDILVFLDIEERSALAQDERTPQRAAFLEVNIFGKDPATVSVCRETIIESAMRCFGLTKSKADIVKAMPLHFREETALRKHLQPGDQFKDAFYQRLREKEDRGILLELKRRGYVLEPSLRELAPAVQETDRIRRTLDYFSGNEYKLVEKKYAILCKQKKEVIFLMRSKEEMQNARALECPKCSRSLGEELVITQYGVTERLKSLLDSSMWMPGLVRDCLVRAGVPKECIETEVKHGEDEIDVLVFYRGRIFIMEVEDRPVNLNDAYKLSAKVSRIEGVLSKSSRPFSADLDGHESEDLECPEFDDEIRPGIRRPEPRIIPVVISTADIANDARDLLTEFCETTLFLESCDGTLDNFIQDMIAGIERGDLEQRFNLLTSSEWAHSNSRLAAAQVRYASSQWLAREAA